ncbi:hypothetical protein WS80_13995 [Burkholderia pseudomultivorans]|nr:hypothetical protein WS80_13995 [Burkholderia pseudomultivorans]
MKPSEMTSGPQIQRLQQQQLEAVKELNPSPNVLAPIGEKTTDTGIANLPLDTPCFPIEAVGRASGSYAGGTSKRAFRRETVASISRSAAIRT